MSPAGRSVFVFALLALLCRRTRTGGQDSEGWIRTWATAPRPSCQMRSRPFTTRPCGSLFTSASGGKHGSRCPNVHFVAMGAPRPLSCCFFTDNRDVELQVGHQPRSSLKPLVVVALKSRNSWLTQASTTATTGCNTSSLLWTISSRYECRAGLRDSRRPEKDQFKKGNDTLRFDRSSSSAVRGFHLDAELPRVLSFPPVADGGS